MKGERALEKHAITPPKFEQGWLHRERLVDLLHKSIPYRLITIRAPAGYGKSTLLADFAAHTDLPVCWIRLTPADRDLMRLASKVASSVEQAIPNFHSRAKIGVTSGSNPVPLARAFAAEMVDSIDSPVVIIVDDVHLVEWPAGADEAFEKILSVLSEQITIIDSGRKMMRRPPYAKLIGEGKIVSLGPQDLALDRQEIMDLARFRRGIELTEEDAGKILEVTKGWVMGVTLLLDGDLATLKNTPQTVNLDTYEYLMVEVVDRLPVYLQRFMRETAVLPVMTGEICDSLLERSQSERTLSELKRQCAFVTSNGRHPKTYEYHPQLRYMLLEEQEKRNADRLKELRRKAAALLAAEGLVELAVALYLDTGSFDQAASLANKHAREMLRMGRDETLQNWADRFESLNASIPMVLVARAISLLRRGEPQKAALSIDRARQSVNRRTSKTTKAYIETAAAMYLFAIGKYEKAEELAGKTLAYIGRRGPRWVKAAQLWLRGMSMAMGLRQFEPAEALLIRAASHAVGGRNQYTLALIMNNLTSVQIALGKMEEAYQSARKSYEVIGSQVPASVSLEAKLLVARVERHRGNIKEAMMRLDEALDDAKILGADQRACEALVEKGMIFSDLGLHDEALSSLREGLVLAEKCANPEQIRNALLCLARAYHRQGDLQSGMAILDAAETREQLRSDDAGLRIERAILKAEEDPAGARRELEQMLDGERIDLGSQMLCQFYSACALIMLEKKAEAIDALNQALINANLAGGEHKLAVELTYSRCGCLQLARMEFGGTPMMLKIEEHLISMRSLAAEVRSKTPPEDSSPMQLSIEALGKVSVRLGGDSIRGPKPRALYVLCYLVDRGYENRDVLLEHFWPGHPPGKGVANLHADVYSLRRAIGKKSIQLEGTTYRINREIPIRYDVAEFDAAALKAMGVSRADPRRYSLLASAIESYTGAFMPGVAAEWVKARRERLELLYLDLLVDYAGEALLCDRPIEALRSIRKAQKIDELREDTNAFLIEALARLGRKAELSGHYHRYVRALRDELGIDPAPIVQKAYARWTDDLSRKPEGD